MDYVQHLAGDALEGRQMNTPGGKAAGDYLAQELKDLGLLPAAPDGEYHPGLRTGMPQCAGTPQGQ